VEDAGDPWDGQPHEDGRPHGLDIVAALAGPGNRAVAGDDRGRIAWAWLDGYREEQSGQSSTRAQASTSSR
jgi:hypothetical protein